jgi:hypothetical protein
MSGQAPTLDFVKFNLKLKLEWYYRYYATPLYKQVEDLYTMVVQSELKYRQYTRFVPIGGYPAEISLFVRIQATDYPQRCFFETIFGYLPQKLKFDSDYKRSKVEELLKEKLTDDEFLAWVEEAERLLLQAIHVELKEMGLKHDFTPDLLVCSSHHPPHPDTHRVEKLGYHTNIDRWTVLSHTQAKLFRNRVVKRLPPIYQPFVDDKPYLPHQQWRILECHKFEKNNVKKVDSKLSTWKPLQDGDNSFRASLIQRVQHCKPLPVTFPEEAKEKKVDSSPINDFEVIPDEAETIIAKLTDASSYEIRKIRGRRVELKRLKKGSSRCPMCSELDGKDHYHENDNPYLFFCPSGKVYFFCRREDPDNLLKGKYHGSPDSRNPHALRMLVGECVAAIVKIFKMSTKLLKVRDLQAQLSLLNF